MDMDGGPGPIASRRNLRTVLRSEREKMGFTQAQVAESVGWSVSKIARIESGRSGISVDDLHKLIRLYEVTEPDRIERMIGWAARTRRHGWWAGYRDVLDRHFATYVGLEGDASRLRFYGLNGIPGALQTTRYARAAIETVTSEPAALERRFELRMHRRKLLFERPDPPQLTFLLDEAVLHRKTGDGAVMHDQMLDIIAAGRLDHVTVRLLPYDRGSHLAGYGGFTLMEFPEGNGVIYTESPLGSSAVDGTAVWALFEEAFCAAEEAALSPGETTAVINKVAETYRP
jgi:transcriptional regulator with XRE-family HTH domain